MSNPTKLAKDMGVSETDLMCLAASVVNSIKKDKVDQIYLNADLETRSDLAEAYVLHANKKYQSFISQYESKPEARKAFVLNILDMCTE